MIGKWWYVCKKSITPCFPTIISVIIVLALLIIIAIGFYPVAKWLNEWLLYLLSIKPPTY